MAGRNAITLVAAAIVAAFASSLSAQQTTIGVPNTTIGHSFYEQFGVNWGIRGNGWFFNFGGPVAPPFGGFDPNAGANFGFGGPNGFINFTAGQGSSSTFSGQAPMVTMMNGGTGVFNDQVLRPFVTGIVPVVGNDAPVFNSVLQERLSRLEAGERTDQQKDSVTTGAASSTKGPSSAERGELSVAEIKARKAAEGFAQDTAADAEIEVLLEKARGALTDGKPGVAKIHLQMAARRATGARRAAILEQIESLGTTK